MKTVDVNLGERAYQIHIGSGLISNAAGFVAPLLKRQRVAIVTDENVACVPGNAFGEPGEGFLRCCFATGLEQIKVACERTERFVKNHNKAGA